jgi:Family of unknown function (DUF5317)
VHVDLPTTTMDSTSSIGYETRLAVAYVLALLVGVAVGYILGGRLRHLGAIRLWPLTFAVGALAFQAALTWVPDRVGETSVRFPLVLLSYIVVISFLVATWLAVRATTWRRVARMAVMLMAAGWFLNFLVISVNGGMPVSRAALERAGFPSDIDVREGKLFKHVPADTETRLEFLGDAIALRPPLQAILSAGDILILAGIAVFLAAGMQGTSRPDLRRRPVEWTAGRRTHE